MLVVCDPDVIIFSVRDIEYKETDDVNTGWSRWARTAIEESARQIYVAEQRLNRMSHVLKQGGSQGVPVPKPMRVHRVAVALGSKGRVPIAQEDFGKGFVHVFEEEFLRIALRELNTITDFVAYLAAKERLLERTLVTTQGEENFLVMYLGREHSFPENADMLHALEGSWDEFTESPQYKARIEADKVSRHWDAIIETLVHDATHGILERDASPSDIEQLVRVMAKERRVVRRMLSKSYLELRELAARKKTRARAVLSPSGITYVFLAHDPGYDRNLRIEELRARCFIARGKYPENKTVVGLATEAGDDKKRSFDALLYYWPEWTAEDEAAM